MPQKTEQKTVFISYRRSASRWITQFMFNHLRGAGYDVFLDIESINAGDFERIILGQIAARAHFLAVLSFESLERLQNPEDWLRREIEFALERKRNVIPVLHGGLKMHQAEPHLTGKLSALLRLNALSIPDDYFEEAMQRLCTRFLQEPVYIPIEEPSAEALKDAQRKLEEAVSEIPPSEDELSAEEWFNRAVELGNNQQYVEAIKAYTQVIRLNPRYNWAYNNRGITYFSLKELDKALADYNKAIELAPQYAITYNNRGVTYHYLKEFKKAILDYETTLSLDPSHPNAKNNLLLAQEALKK